MRIDSSYHVFPVPVFRVNGIHLSCPIILSQSNRSKIVKRQPLTHQIYIHKALRNTNKFFGVGITQCAAVSTNSERFFFYIIRICYFVRIYLIIFNISTYRS